MNLKKDSLKNILITGGTQGLGLATAKCFAQPGNHLYLSFRSDLSTANQAAKQIFDLGATCDLFACDLTEEEGIHQLFEQIKSKTSTLDIYIHNAAATAFKNLLELKSHHIDKTFNMSVKSFILGVQHATSLMPQGGAIVSVSGMDTLKAVPRHGLLGAAKSALETLTSYYAHELASKNIKVNGINPGFFETQSTRKYLGSAFDLIQKKLIALTPSKRAASLEEIAKIILFLCSEDSNWIVGQTLKVDGGADFALPLD